MNIEQIEIWAEIPGLPGYEASSFGRIRSVGRLVRAGRGVRRVAGKVLLLSLIGKGYLVFRTTQRTHLVSRTVLRAFVGEPASASMQACHNNGVKTDNRLENLRWDTPAANEMDKVEHGTHHRGERHPAAKLSNEQVAAIRSDFRLHREIALDYGVSRNHVSSIKANCFRRFG